MASIVVMLRFLNSSRRPGRWAPASKARAPGIRTSADRGFTYVAGSPLGNATRLDDHRVSHLPQLHLGFGVVRGDLAR